MENRYLGSHSPEPRDSVYRQAPEELFSPGPPGSYCMPPSLTSPEPEQRESSTAQGKHVVAASSVTREETKSESPHTHEYCPAGSGLCILTTLRCGGLGRACSEGHRWTLLGCELMSVCLASQALSVRIGRRWRGSGIRKYRTVWGPSGACEDVAVQMHALRLATGGVARGGLQASGSG